MKKKLGTKRWNRALLSLLIALICVALYEHIVLLPEEAFLDAQQSFAYLSFIASVTLLVYFILQKQYVKAIILAILPLLIYDIVNYSIEAVRIATDALKFRGELSRQDQISMNIMLSLADLKIAFSFLSLIVWYWVWMKVKRYESFCKIFLNTFLKFMHRIQAIKG